MAGRAREYPTNYECLNSATTVNWNWLMSDQKKKVTLAQLQMNCMFCDHVLEVASERWVESDDGQRFQVLEMRDVIRDALLGKEETCPNPDCGKKVDWWKIVRRKMKDSVTDSSHSGVLLGGGQITQVEFTLNPAGHFDLHFAGVGIPHESTVLSVEYFLHLEFPMPRFVIPLENYTTTDSSQPIRREFPESVTLSAVPAVGDVFDGEDPVPTKWTAQICWIPPTLEEAAIAHLMTAFHAFDEGRVLDVPLPAQTAIEETLRTVLDVLFRQHDVGRDKRKNLLNATLSFNQQLSVLYPVVVSLLHGPPLHDEVRHAVTELATTRNKIAHNFDVPTPEASNVSLGLTGCLFLLKHLVHMRSLVSELEARV